MKRNLRSLSLALQRPRHCNIRVRKTPHGSHVVAPVLSDTGRPRPRMHRCAPLPAPPLAELRHTDSPAARPRCICPSPSPVDSVPLTQPGPPVRRRARAVSTTSTVARDLQHQCSRSKRSTSPRTTSRAAPSNSPLTAPPVAARSSTAYCPGVVTQARSILTRLSMCASTRSSRASTRRCAVAVWVGVVDVEVREARNHPPPTNQNPNPDPNLDPHRPRPSQPRTQPTRKRTQPMQPNPQTTTTQPKPQGPN